MSALARATWVAGLAVVLLAPARAIAQRPDRRSNFDHPKHQKLFPSCTTCHAGAASAGASLWPAAASCVSCHDGTIQKAVQWRPPAAPSAHNLKFEHQTHARVMTERAGRGGLPPPVDSSKVSTCIACHSEVSAPWMAVRWAVTGRCLDCHGVSAPHLAAPDSACATCHVTLAQATRLTARDVAEFPAPPSHKVAGFTRSTAGGAGGAAGGHGVLAKAQRPVAASCATCHARDFCIQCHVDAPEQSTIQALASDARSLAIRARIAAPATHAAATFLMAHGALARNAPQDCSSCHTRESCLTCHVTLPRVVAVALPSAGRGRGESGRVRAVGAMIVRRPPPSHGESFVRDHRAAANAVPNSCAGCHVRNDCLQCHRPDAARAAGGGYHPGGFLTRHPAAAYAREASCSDCHNTAGFCATCHLNAGLSAQRSQFRARYHDAKQFFQVGHGGAARQSLETCVSCHAERDCLTCHSALGGRHFNPHGPGFDAKRLAKKNPQMCSACHGGVIPTR